MLEDTFLGVTCFVILIVLSAELKVTENAI